MTSSFVQVLALPDGVTSDFMKSFVKKNIKVKILKPDPKRTTCLKTWTEINDPKLRNLNRPDLQVTISTSNPDKNDAFSNDKTMELFYHKLRTILGEDKTIYVLCTRTVK